MDFGKFLSQAYLQGMFQIKLIALNHKTFFILLETQYEHEYRSKKLYTWQKPNHI